jgi:hypothetical protein
MSEQRNEDLTHEERRAFGSLAANVTPSSALEDRVVGALREQGLVRRVSWWERAFATVPRPVRLATAAVALVFTFVAGVEYGKRSDDAAIPEVRLDPAAEEETPEAVEPRDTGGALMASTEVGSEDEMVVAGLEKPQLASLDEGHGDFPPYPLEGRPRAISPKYR